jgi:hypothetical protein
MRKQPVTSEVRNSGLMQLLLQLAVIRSPFGLWHSALFAPGLNLAIMALWPDWPADCLAVRHE